MFGSSSWEICMFYIVNSTRTHSCSEEKSESHVVYNCPLGREKKKNLIPYQNIQVVRHIYSNTK